MGVPNPPEATRKNKRKRNRPGGWREKASAQGCQMRRGGHRCSPCPPSFSAAISYLLRTEGRGARKARSLRGAPCPHPRPLASPPKARAQVVRELGTDAARRCAANAAAGIQRRSPGPPGPHPSAGRGSSALCRGEVTQVALQDPKTPLPLSPARLREPGPSKAAPRVRLCFLFSAPTNGMSCFSTKSKINFLFFLMS